MRLVKSAKLAAVALAAASGVALAIAPANATTTPLKAVECASGAGQLQFQAFVSMWPRACFKGSGDLDVKVTSSIFGRAGDHSGYVIYDDGTKVNFTKGTTFGSAKTVVHIHTD
ncbi:hypothetical protein ACFY41_15270 [Streptomyces syringium]|uniref:hypothetical protein n=1 Tax=Streptomyces syringium TaxID=76729 RepID=UPI0036BF88C5